MILDVEKYDLPRILWTSYRTTILRLATVLLSFVAITWITMNYVMLFQEIRWGGMDFMYRYREVQYWFSGRDVYGLGPAVYPPASYAILWLLQGWLPVFSAKVVWAGTMTFALAWLVYHLVRASGADSTLERLFVISMLLSMDAVGFDIGHGQLPIFTVSALVAGIMMLCYGQDRWRNDLIGAGLIVVALIKPTISAPFFWIVILIPGRWRPATLVLLGYTVLTLAAIPFQGGDMVAIFQGWIEKALAASEWGAIRGGYSNLHTLLGDAGLQWLNFPISISILLAVGYWAYRHRHADLWILLGVTALLARFWVYHRAYDDVLILLPMITLFRIAKDSHTENRDGIIAGGLLALLIIASLVSSLKLVIPDWEPYLKTMRGTVYAIVLIFLFYRGWYEQKSGSVLRLFHTKAAKMT